MRVATGILFGMWLLFMGYQFITIEPIGYDGQETRAFTAIILFLQAISWAFIFTLPLTTFVILLLAECFTVMIALTYDPSYFVFVVINLIFIIMSLAGYMELKKKKTLAKKQTKTA